MTDTATTPDRSSGAGPNMTGRRNTGEKQEKEQHHE